MGNFCKGLLLGMVGGACVGAVIVAKNKKLSSKLKEGIETVEDKFNEVKTDIEEKFSKKNCDCESDNYCQNKDYCDCEDSDFKGDDYKANNKKTKNSQIR